MVPDCDSTFQEGPAAAHFEKGQPLRDSQSRGQEHEVIMIADTERRAYNTEVNGDDFSFSLRPLLSIVWKRLWIVLLVMVLFSGAAVGRGLQETPLYEASTKILIGREGGITQNPGDVVGYKELAMTMAEAIVSRPVAESAIQQQDLELNSGGLLAGLSAEVVPETQFIEVHYVDSDPERARRVVNAVGTAFSQRVSVVSRSNSDITATVWEPAITPASPVSPTPLRDGVIALVLGGMLGLGLAFLLEHLDDSWKSPGEAEQVSGVPTFGVIPEARDVNHEWKAI
jgi:capsular polysaccharide biosynthesis protein